MEVPTSILQEPFRSVIYEIFLLTQSNNQENAFEGLKASYNKTIYNTGCAKSHFTNLQAYSVNADKACDKKRCTQHIEVFSSFKDPVGKIKIFAFLSSCPRNFRLFVSLLLVTIALVDENFPSI